MSNTISREYSISASHRIEGHPKCGRLHGHNYRITISISSSVLNGMGFVIDFGDIDREMKPIIDQLDHRHLVSQANVQAGCPYVEAAKRRGDAFMLGVPQSSAEYLAQLIHLWTYTTLKIRPSDCTVTVMETDKNVAMFTLEQ